MTKFLEKIKASWMSFNGQLKALYSIIKDKFQVFHFKVSFRAYILFFPITLFLIVLLFMLGLGNYLNHQYSARLASSFLTRSSLNIYYEFDRLVDHVDYTLLTTKKLVQGNILSFTDRRALDQYLFHILKANPEAHGVFLADNQGDFYVVRQLTKDEFVSVYTIGKEASGQMQVEIQWYKNGKVVKYAGSQLTDFKVQAQKWYQAALNEEKVVWTGMHRSLKGLLWLPNKTSITASLLIPNASNKKRYVFAIDVDLKALETLLNNEYRDPATIAFLVDQNDQIKRLHVSQDMGEKFHFSFSGGSNQVLNDLLLPWAEQSLKEQGKNASPSFLYKFLGNRYIASYRDLMKTPHVFWKLGVVRPLEQGINQLNSPNKLWNSVIILVYLIGIAIFIVLLFLMTRPIKEISEEIDKLKSFQFDENAEEKKPFIKEFSKFYEVVDFAERAIKSFSRYVPMPVVKNIMESGSVAHVSGESRQVTILFSDIRSFTTISENMQPRELMQYLSDYFETTTNIILSKRGTLDKYIGDGIMAFWGAPFDDKHHTLHACQCATMLQEAIGRLNSVFARRDLPQISLRIGVSTGHAVVGNVGSSYRLNYTAMGDAVNLSSRLEGLNKLYGTNILVDENAYKAISDQFNFRLIDLVAVKGKKQSVYIYELINREDFDLDREELKQYNKSFMTAFNLYRVGDWKKADKAFKELQKKYPTDKLLELYIDRCHYFKDKPPAHWDGVFDVVRFDTSLKKITTSLESQKLGDVSTSEETSSNEGAALGEDQNQDKIVVEETPKESKVEGNSAENKEKTESTSKEEDKEDSKKK